MADSTSPAETSCAVCGKGALTRCRGCLEGVDQDGGPSPTFYCGKDCQASHWKEHKNDCKLANVRKRLYRAGDLLQAIWQVYREVAYDMPATSLVKSGNKLIMHTRPTEYEEWPLSPFPDDLQLDDSDKQALLMYNTCDDVLIYMLDIIQRMMTACHKNILGPIEVVVKVEEHRRRIDHYQGDVSRAFNSGHDLLVVQLEDDVQYAIDLTGAQYGQIRPVLPFTKYKTEHCSRAKRFRECGETALMLSLAGVVDDDVRTINLQLTKCLEATIEQFEKSTGRALTKIIDEDHHAYASDKQSLLMLVQRDLVAKAQALQIADGRPSLPRILAA